MNQPSSHLKQSLLFFSTFVSAFLLIMGLGITYLLFVPALSHIMTPAAPYHPQLPLAGNRDQALVDLTKEITVQLFPHLTNPEQVTPGNWIRIPSIGVNVPLANSPTLEDKDIIATLEQGAALYPNGIIPGRLGNVFIAAHSTGNPWQGAYRFAFLDINKVKPDNVIHLDYNQTRYTYRVVGSDLIKPTQDFRLASDRPLPTVTLMACWPLWSTNQRILVKGELVNITKLTPQPS